METDRRWLPLAAVLIAGGCQVTAKGIELDNGFVIEEPRLCVPHDLPDPDSFGRTGDVVCGIGGSISGPLSQFMSEGGAGAIAIDFSRSNLAIPAQHRVGIEVRNVEGGLIAANSFDAVSSSGRIRASNPAAVDSWLINNSANAASVDLALEPFATNQVFGENVAIAELEINGAVTLSKGDLWTNSDCNEGVDPESGAPYVCNTGY